MAYDLSMDKINRRSRPAFSSHTANLLPLYGRSKGESTSWPVLQPGCRTAGVRDPLHHEDRKKNAHMLILGPTGAGKSALLVYLLRRWPRCTARASSSSRPVVHSLLGQDFLRPTASVNQVTLNPNVDVSLPPFADALCMLEKENRSNHHRS